MNTASHTIDLSILRNIQTKLYTPPLLTHPNLEGIFYRGQDFTKSHAQLNETFFNEFKEASIGFAKSKTAEELHNNLANTLNIHSSGENHFTTNELSPALRHFINDSCRLLEPFTKLFSEKFPNVQLRERESLNTYVRKLRDNQEVLNFDVDFIMDLYEVWNDYKHRATKGVGVKPWKYENNRIKKPSLALDDTLNLPSLQDLTIDDFQNQTTAKLLELINFVKPENILHNS